MISSDHRIGHSSLRPLGWVPRSEGRDGVWYPQSDQRDDTGFIPSGVGFGDGGEGRECRLRLSRLSDETNCLHTGPDGSGNLGSATPCTPVYHGTGRAPRGRWTVFRRTLRVSLDPILLGPGPDPGPNRSASSSVGPSHPDSRVLYLSSLDPGLGVVVNGRPPNPFHVVEGVITTGTGFTRITSEVEYPDKIPHYYITYCRESCLIHYPTTRAPLSNLCVVPRKCR